MSEVRYLIGTGAARAAGTGVVTRKLLHRSDAAARAEGTGNIKRSPCVGAAAAEGVGFLTWPHPAVTPGLADIWFYGTTTVKRMPGEGAARAEGYGTLSV